MEENIHTSLINSPTDERKKSYIGIDLLRAIAALSVFFYHQHFGALLANVIGFNWFKLTDVFGASYAVPLFFLLSGYCIHLSGIKYLKNDQPLPLGQYLLQRFRRIYPAYAIGLLLSISVNLITHYDPKITIIDILTHLFLVQGFISKYFNTINVVFWTISVEMGLYILYPVFYKLRHRMSLNYAMTVVLCCSLLSLTFFSVIGHLTFPNQYCVFNIWFSWCWGAYLADKKTFCPSYFNRSVFLLLYSCLLIGFVALTWLVPNAILFTYQLAIMAWTGPLLFFVSKEHWFAKQTSFIIKGLTYIGLSSYSLYLLHEPLIALKSYLLHLILPATYRPVGVILALILVPLIAWYSYFLFEKPFMNRKKEIFHE